eukprot:jgi/Bigna1/76631/fgenesh1_pg.42_\
MEPSASKDCKMEYNTLGSSDVKVSERSFQPQLCFGTMTFGVQNSKEQAFEMLDYAYKCGVNFIDTAEMYPVPPTEKTQGLSEKIVGAWMKERGIRDKIVLATKVTGRSEAKGYVNKTRGLGDDKKCATLDEKSILAACDASLKRLQTDYIDLYQIHWPDRYVPLFGRARYDRTKEHADYASFEDQVIAIGKLIKAGKIKHWVHA